ncbi:unnamed protein product [Mesocestoides corti]|uniref:RRM domain-containing protein n=1 Tax=Mesocestoides corti TaxID=53468 RepID=A0A0R3UBH4_MESCO|nr:unnamed protein product [Mesocestoides corti]
MTGDFEVDSKPQLCDVGVDGTRPKEPNDDSSKPVFDFSNPFQSNGSKSTCRGDVNEEQNIDASSGFCRQGLGDHPVPQNKIASCSLYCNDPSTNSSALDPMEGNIESLKALSLKTDGASTTFQSLNTVNVKPRDMPFSTMTGDANPFVFERSQSAQKFDSCNFLSDSINTSTNSKSHSTPESSSGIDSAYSSANPRSQLLADTDNPPSTCDNHLGGSSASYWSAAGTGQSEEINPQSALSLNNLPLLTSLLFQQSTNAPTCTTSGSQSNPAAAVAVAAKRAIIGGHQSMRPSLTRPPGWNPTTNALESNFITSTPDQSVFCPPSTATGLSSSKSSGWMSHFSSHSGNSYPWASSTASQQAPFKPNFGDFTSSGFSTNTSGNFVRFGMNTGLSNVGSNGFSKGTNPPNPASLYSMFPKRPPHRLMTHWQQQQHHQQHLQQTPSSILSKQHNSDFSSQPGPSPFGGQENVLNQKIPHSTFGPPGPGSGVTPIPNSLMSGNMDGLNSEKFSGSDNYRSNYGFDQHLLELMKSIDSSGNPPSSLLDDLTLNMPTMDNYHGTLHSLPNLSQSRPAIIPPSSMQAQGLHGMGHAHSSLSAMAPREEGYSRKVFVGGLPPDIDEEEITTAFRRFGALIVDWPHKTESKAYFPPKGYCFLLFQEEQSVQDLINACIVDEGKYYWCVSSPTMKDKPVQIRPWNLADSDFVMDGSQTLDPRKTIFVGGVPRPLRAIELALIMDRLYGGVCYAGIDIDPELKYPKGAGRVAFSNQQSYIAAISARFVQLQHNDIDKRVELYS